MPATDLSGTWVFEPEDSDPMLSVWADKNPRYDIQQYAAFIVLTFRVDEDQPNRQRYAWDGSIARFERGAQQVEEAARWTDAGLVLEVRGRSFDPEAPEDATMYGFTYELVSDHLVFTQTSDTGETVWRFARQRER